MNWFSSLFSASNSRNSRKGQAMSSTHEAFSLPTSSPIFSAHPDTLLPVTPDPESASSSYTYPPQGPNSYGYVPTSGGSKSRRSSLLPLHHDQFHTPSSSLPPYPPLATTWGRLQAWLSREYPELGDTLNYGILPEDLGQVEMQFGFALPTVLRESYLCVDGQEPESSAGCTEGLFFGLTFLPLEDVVDEWKFWREVDDDPSTGANPQLREAMQSIPPNWIRREYSQRGWIPLIADKAGNYIGIDLNPDNEGSAGQVIVFGRDFDTKVVLYNGDGSAGWAKWLAAFVEELESGDGFEIGGGEDSGSSEDEIGYENYYHDGTGFGQGDGGGDSGSRGGIRMTGEYRGWNVMEAWADRSVRKWYETGVISGEKSQDEKGKSRNSMGLGVLDVPQLPQDSGAEVAIPVFQEGSPNDANVGLGSRRKAASDLPTISVTKPPVPMPVELPTRQDIVSLPSPPDSTHSSFDEDLESGRARGMRQTPQNQGPLGSTPASEPKPTVNFSPLIPTDSAEPLDMSARISPPPETEIPDLLADSAPVMETTPVIQPSVPLPIISPPATSPCATPVESNTHEHFIVAAEAEEEEVDPDTTIRLVGGGGHAGLVDTTPSEVETIQENEPEHDNDTASVTSAASNTSKETKKKHKKSGSSLANLKKLGLGMRKKNSVSSVKDVVS